MQVKDSIGNIGMTGGVNVIIRRILLTIVVLPELTAGAIIHRE